MLLSQLRETRAIQIIVETEVVDLPDAFVATLPKTLTEDSKNALGLALPTGSTIGLAPATQPGNIATDLTPLYPQTTPSHSVDAETLKRITLAAKSRAAIPRLTMFSGESEETSIDAGERSVKHSVQATASSDRSYITVSVQPAGTNAATTLWARDGETMLLRYDRVETGRDSHRWLLMRPSIIVQR